jgi:hypothetical protein
LNFYTSTTSSLVNSRSNSSNSSSKSISLSKNYNKDGDLHPILGSLGQFLLTKINFSKFFVCKWHVLRLVRILAKEKMFSISIWDPIIPKICQAKSPTIGNIASCLCHHWKGYLMSLTSNWYLLKIKNSLLTSFYMVSLTSHSICSNISKL